MRNQATYNEESLEALRGINDKLDRLLETESQRLQAAQDVRKTINRIERRLKETGDAVTVAE